MSWFRRKPTPTPTPAPTPAPAPVPPLFLTSIFGVALGDFSMELAAFNAAAGKPVNVVSIYQSHFWDKNFPTDQCNKISASGAVPMVTWEFWEPNGVANQPLYSLDKIIAGSYDSYIRTWAQQVKEYGKTVLLRWNHEMNGDWYPWGTVGGNTPTQYVQAYKRVRNLFNQAGVTNVAWIWSPNVDFPIAPFYPGDTEVDYVALDGYNWNTSTPEQVFGQTINEIRATTKRPLFIGETGTPQNSGKAQWFADFFKLLKDRNLAGFIWFNFKKEEDWRIQSSPESQTAFKNGVSTL